MAAMNNQLVRPYRDIDGWAAAEEQNVQTLMHLILDLDEEIAIAAENEAQGLLPSVPFDFGAASQQRGTLYGDLQVARQRLTNLQRSLHQRLRLQYYLEACHSIDLAMPARDVLPSTPEVSEHEVIESIAYPRHIVPAVDFAEEQMDIWHKLAASPVLHHDACYSNFLELEWVRATVDGNIVGCPYSLSAFMGYAVDRAVKAIMNRIAQEDQLIQSLGIRPFVERVGNHGIVDLPRSPIQRGLSTMFSYATRPGHGTRPVPVLVTCYRPPHRLSLNEILSGLQGGIDVFDDVIASPTKGYFSGMSRVLVAAVISRLFDHMLVVSTRFGYITTGEAYIFVEICDDARILKYSVCVPRHDVEADPVTGLHRTAVAQVLAFTLRALEACETRQMPPEWYHETRQALWRWHVNPDDIFNKIPPLTRKMQHQIAHVPDDWSPVSSQSPIQQRLPYVLLPGFRPRSNEAAFNDFGFFRFFSDQHIDPAGVLIDQRPFCTPDCLWGLEHFHSLDKDCPNFRYHGDKHLGLQELLDGLRTQLDDDVANGNHDNYQFLRRCGPYTMLLKVRLASHGYTLLLKGVIPAKVDHLRREVDMYGHLLEVQGSHVPVCFGMIQTQGEVSSNTYGEFTNFMVFGGFPEGVMSLSRCRAAGMNRRMIADAVDETFQRIHEERVLHFDPEPRNMLYDARAGRVMIVDFERAVYDEFRGQQYLNATVHVGGVDEWRLEPVKMELEGFLRERRYVRRRFLEFWNRGY
ncbi:hypothetical protein ACHAPE_003979 [Trichoderma viride]